MLERDPSKSRLLLAASAGIAAAAVWSVVLHLLGVKPSGNVTKGYFMPVAGAVALLVLNRRDPASASRADGLATRHRRWSIMPRLREQLELEFVDRQQTPTNELVRKAIFFCFLLLSVFYPLAAFGVVEQNIPKLILIFPLFFLVQYVAVMHIYTLWRRRRETRGKQRTGP